LKIVEATRPLLVCLLAVGTATITAGQASAATLTVCPTGCAFSQIAPALAAANNVSGGGINVFGPTTLRNSTVSGNTVDANGASGSARGGGIYDGFNSDGPPGGPLVLQNNKVTANTLSGARLLLQGGGIYLQGRPITLTNSLITQNVPDQCFGC